MLITVEGIVIGRRTIGEANCFIDILTKEYGVIEVTAHGVNKINSKNMSATSLFSYAVFCLSKNGTKYALNSSQPKYSFYNISQSIENLALASYFAEIVKFSSASEQPDENALRFFAITLYELEKSNIPAEQIKAVFELRICAMLGFMPDLRACRFCACYESETMFFLDNDGVIVCGDCAAENDEFLRSHEFTKLSPALLYAMRYCIFTELDRTYKFTLTADLIKVLSMISERYILSQMNRSFRSLEYYKQLSFEL